MQTVKGGTRMTLVLSDSDDPQSRQWVYFQCILIKMIGEYDIDVMATACSSAHVSVYVCGL